MTFQQTLDYLYDQLPMYQSVGNSAIKKDLTNTYALLEGLGNPHELFKSIHIAGTNGKGTSAHSIAAILQCAGYKTGLYTSPHLRHFTERIRVDGVEASEVWVVQFVKQNKQLIEHVGPSFFEITVVMAFQYFVERQVDVAVIEVGLGGRLDSTNVIKPLVSLITSIGMDHQELLGDTLEAIAAEKAGIVKAATPVVIGDTHEELVELFQLKAEKMGAPISFARDQLTVSEEGNRMTVKGTTISFEPSIKGDYYKYNLPGIIRTITALREMGWAISDQCINDGLENVVKLTGLKGRWQVIQENPRVICDVGHNVDGLSFITRQLQKEAYKRLWIVFGGVKEKRWSELIQLLPKEASYFICQPSIPRAQSALELVDLFSARGLDAKIEKDVNTAVEKAKGAAGVEDLIFIGGSTFVVAEIEGL